ncbi:hypothetical protein N9549_02575 [Acidimicrobiales bacterium]|nr:hypothetical protein [Acidimicrobiales bacterium]
MGTDQDKQGVRYRCTTKAHYGKTGCAKGTMIKAGIADRTAVLAALHRLDSAMAAATYKDEVTGEVDSTEFDRIARNFKAIADPADDLRRYDLEAAISERRLQLNHASDLWAAGRIDVEQFTKLSHDGKRQIEAWQAELATLPDDGGATQLNVNARIRLERLGEGPIGVGALAAAFVTACGSLEIARDVLASVFDSITVGPQVNGQKPADRLTFT